MAVDTDVDRHRDRVLERIGKLWDRRENLLLAATGLTGFLLLWSLGARTVSPDFMLPSPLASGRAFVGLFTETIPYTLPVVGQTTVPVGLVKLLQSLTHYVPGVIAGTIVGICLGIVTALFPRVKTLLSPIIGLLRPIPPLAWMAFAIIWFGIQHAGAAFIVFIGAIWINFYGAYSGVEDVPERLPEVAESLGVDSTIGMVRQVILPAAAPAIITSFRTSVGRCWMILVGAELFGAPGAGYEIINAANNLAMDVSVAYMILVSGTFVLMDAGVGTLERRVLAWR
ncbi:ABC transporter permease [Natronorubrum sp. DTA7]|uniref:ABC transporter permease n=1 Tax=Natronorubrum sp. DTA7 TaxID=3447016 RepID=UPI003F87E2EF